MDEHLPLQPTCYQWLTPAAPAAIAIFWTRVNWRLFDREPPAVGHARFARLIDPAGDVIDEVVVVHLSGDILEVQCHGGPGQRQRIDAALQAHGLRFTDDELIDPLWDRMSRIAHPAALPLVLGERRLPAGFPEELCYRLPMVLIAGPANAGKSSLLNAWCGHGRALVADQAGTTRDLVWAEVEAAGWRLRICDSAGQRTTDDALERAGQELVAQARARADLVIWLAPVDQAEAMDGAQPGDLVVQGKADLPGGGDGLGWCDPAHGGDDRAEALLRGLESAVLARLGLAASAG